MKTQSRMDKYYDLTEHSDIDNGETKVVSKRTKKNQELYKEVSNLELNDFDLNSNVSILGDNPENIDISELEEQLSQKYKQEPRNRGLGNTDEIPLPKINLDETREYDINAIIEKAKEQKEVDYEEDRLKKLRNTQYNILMGLDILKETRKDKEDEEEINRVLSDSRELKELIDTITAKELIKEEENIELSDGEDLDPLDLLSDLRGDDDSTRVMGALEASEIEEKTSPKEDKEEEPTKETEDKSLEDDEPEEEPVEEPKEEKMTKTMALTQSEFDDFKDLKEEMNNSKIIVTVLVIILILLFIAGAIIIANYYLKLGLF